MLKRFEMKGLYWGRFNPPHKGHMKVVKRILKEVDSLIIAVGNSKEYNTKKNLFSGWERKKMWKRFLKEEGISLKKVRVIPVPDEKSFSDSIDNLFKKCKNFDVLYTDREEIIKLVKDKVKIRRLKREGKISATKIREEIVNDRDWEKFTGNSVARLIKKFDGIRRIKEAYSNS